ncbi:MAG: ABC-ATPase domain-containing protein [Candidatus Bipolaricaulota bacterium]
MRDQQVLRSTLQRIDGAGYGAYKDIRGAWAFDDFTLHVDHVQGDPFAAPSRLRITVRPEVASFPGEAWSTPSRRVGLEDYLVRALDKAIAKCTKGGRGSGKSGRFSVVDHGPCVVRRTAMRVDENGVEAVISCGLPAAGRRVLGRQAMAMLLEELPQLARQALRWSSLPQEAVRAHVRCVEDADALRAQLRSEGLVALVNRGAMLPRASGVSQRPLAKGAVPFDPPESLEVSLERPNGPPVSGMGIPEGVTLVVGGGYHGKSTLLSAVSRGVYNHIPGDGREFVIAVPETVIIRAEDGRSVCGTDISSFIGELPGGQDTARFQSENASGSTSQAANIAEALESGAGTLLVDEDTSATNFMIRDERMQQLVSKDKEPITPFVDRVRELYEALGVSTVLVMGGSGDYFGAADTVIMMHEYRPLDVTAQAKSLAQGLRRAETAQPLSRPTPRHVNAGSLSARDRRGKRVVRADHATLRLGNARVDLTKLHQFVELSQVRGAGHILAWVADNLREPITVAELLDRVEQRLAAKGMEGFVPARYGDLSQPRRFELACVLNRVRGLKLRTP